MITTLEEKIDNLLTALLEAAYAKGARKEAYALSVGDSIEAGEWAVRLEVLGACLEGLHKTLDGWKSR